MNKFTRNQFYYTTLFLDAAKIEVDDESGTTPLVDFWWNHANPLHLRLSRAGFTFISHYTKIPYYTINLDSTLTNQNLIDLARLPIGPYYIHHKEKQIIVLDQNVATMLLLHSGNISQYLANAKM